MGLVVSVPPTQEPITLQDAKDHCKVDGAEDDALLRSYIVAARSYVETATDRTLPQTTYQLTLDKFCDEIKIPKPPLISVSSITYIDANGTTQTLSASVYFVDTTTPQGRIVLKPGQSWPALGSAVYPVTITFVAGYTISNVPEAAKHAIRLMVSHFNSNRDAVTEGSMTQLPLAVDSLLGVLNWGCYP